MLALVQGCVVVNQEMVLRVLDGVYIGARGCRTNMAVHGGDYDEVFHIDPALYICWAAYKKYNQILMRQLEKHQKIYLQMMNRDECQRQLSICRRAWGYVTDSYICGEIAKFQNCILTARSLTMDAQIEHLRCIAFV